MLLKIKKTIPDVPLWNNRGFTMLEMLLSILAFIVIASMLPGIMKAIFDEGFLESGIRRMEWEVFSSQIKKEIRSADQYTVSQDKIMLEKDGKIILYEKYGTSMRRRVDFQGHEILMQNLSWFYFKKIREGFEVSASDLNGTEYSIRVQNIIQAGEVSP
jgi:competence protein ComGF